MKPKTLLSVLGYVAIMGFLVFSGLNFLGQRIEPLLKHPGYTELQASKAAN